MLRRKLAHVGIGCLLCVGGVVFVPSPAAADDGPASAVEQYVEMIPTADGSHSVAAKPSKSSLPPVAKAALGRADPAVADQLEELATSPAYGAAASRPAHHAANAPAKPSDAVRPANGHGSAVTEPGSISTLGFAGNDPVILGLVIILGLSTLAIVAVAAAERRRDGTTPPRNTGG